MKLCVRDFKQWVKKHIFLISETFITFSKYWLSSTYKYSFIALIKATQVFKKLLKKDG